jgi:type I site-specific restriction-modification system R (restriction) subunit
LQRVFCNSSPSSVAHKNQKKPQLARSPQEQRSSPSSQEEGKFSRHKRKRTGKTGELELSVSSEKKEKKERKKRERYWKGEEVFRTLFDSLVSPFRPTFPF